MGRVEFESNVVDFEIERPVLRVQANGRDSEVSYSGQLELALFVLNPGLGRQVKFGKRDLEKYAKPFTVDSHQTRIMPKYLRQLPMWSASRVQDKVIVVVPSDIKQTFASNHKHVRPSVAPNSEN